uniref:serine/threonine-protein kinase n=1 Tax=Promineifilum sp. TaxID=2664178 RepID=UPI0035B48D52
TDPQERATAVAQFRHEAQLLRRLRHPNLPVVTDEFTLGDRNYLVMEYVPGSTLQQMIERGEAPFDERRVVTWAAQLCDVLGYLHRQEPPIIFRDLKPGNIMIMADDRLKLIDFGIARVFKPGKKQDTMIFGTQGFAAPEQYGSGQTDERSDIYALGATLYSLLTGQDPGRFRPFEPLPPIRTYRPDISPQLETVVMRATRVKPVERWQSTQDLRQAMSGGAPQATVIAPPAGRASPPPPPGPIVTRRPTTRLLLKAATLSPAQLALAGGALLLIIALAIVPLTRLLEGTAFWEIVRTSAIIAPFAYTASRRRLVGGIAHFIGVSLIGWLIILADEATGRVGAMLFISALVSAAAIEGMIFFLPRVMGSLRRDDPGAWQREALWLGLAALLGHVVLYALLGDDAAINALSWVSAFLLAVAGWFLGDLVQGYLYLKQTGVRWR